MGRGGAGWARGDIMVLSAARDPQTPQKGKKTQGLEPVRRFDCDGNQGASKPSGDASDRLALTLLRMSYDSGGAQKFGREKHWVQKEAHATPEPSAGLMLFVQAFRRRGVRGPGFPSTSIDVAADPDPPQTIWGFVICCLS